MRVVTDEELSSALSSVARSPLRAVVSGNYATPWHALAVLDRTDEQAQALKLSDVGDSDDDEDGMP
jgi:hypothetical protein